MLRMLQTVLRVLSVILAFAGLAHGQQVSVVNLDLAGTQFGTGVSINESSAPQLIKASSVYRFVLSGKVHGTGLLAAAVPNGTDISQLVTQLGGDPSLLQGTVNNPNSALPFTFINQTFNQTVGSGLTSATVALKMLGRIDANGTVTFSVTNVNITAAGFPVTDKIVFEAGSKLFVGIPPILQFGSATVTVNEGDANVVLPVTRTENLTGTVTVNYATSNGSALAGTDFTAASGTLSFAVDDGSEDITIPLLPNTDPDGDRSFTVTITTPGGGGFLGTVTVATVTILDDDVAGDAPRIRFTTDTFISGEDQAEAVVTIERTGDTSAAATVNYATADDTATAPAHYTATSGTATFAIGESQVTFAVPLVDDSVKNGARAFKLSLSSPSAGSVLGSRRLSRVVIADNEISSFQAFRGLYTGLIQSAPFDYAKAGSVRVTILPTGKFTAQVKYGGKTNNLVGTFNTSGRAEVSFSRTSLLTLSLRISTTSPNTLTGAVMLLGQEQAQCVVKKAVYSATNLHPRPGRYNLLLEPPALPVGETPATLPLGPGYGTFILGKTGTAKFVGKLGDGSRIVIAGSVAQDGALPVHLPLYKTGLLFGEVYFRSMVAPTDLEGTLRWRKLNDRPKDRAYAGGFDTTATVAGSFQVKPPLDERVLNLPTGTIEVGGGNIAEADWFTRSFGMNTRNFVQILNPGADGIKLVLNPVTGAITGRFILPGSKKAKTFAGVLLRKQNRAAGLFIGTAEKGIPVESGWVSVGP